MRGAKAATPSPAMTAAATAATPPPTNISVQGTPAASRRRASRVMRRIYDQWDGDVTSTALMPVRTILAGGHGFPLRRRLEAMHMDEGGATRREGWSNEGLS